MKISSAVIWSKDSCPFCLRAKKLLERHDIAVVMHNISGPDWTREQLLEVVPSAKMVPQIFIDDTYIGGYDELKKFMKDRT